MRKRIIFRVPDTMYKEVNKAVKDGRAKNASDLTRLALKEFLEKKVEQ